MLKNTQKEKIKKTVIITGYACNNFCRFCMNTHKRSMPQRSTGEILVEISKARRRGRNYLEIIGGEQTIRPDIARIIKHASGAGFRDIVMATNGRLFAYPDFARKVIKAGLTELIFSIHAHTPELFDKLTQVPGSFNQLKKGIANVKGPGGCKIGSNTAIVKQNYRFLPQIGRFIYELGIRNAEFIFVDPTRGGALDDFEGLVPRISDIAPYARKCLDIGRIGGARHWHIRYVPLCYFPDHEDQISEIDERKAVDTEHIGPDFANFDITRARMEVGRIKPSKCKVCLKFDLCEGIWREYYRRYGDKELRPIRKIKN